MVEDVIREAMERGEFDNLPGKGKPLDLSQNPLLDPMTAIVHRILRDNGVSHPLIEARKTIEAERDAARNDLARAWRLHGRASTSDPWDTAVTRFRARVSDINRQIRMFNLKAPSPVMHGLMIDADAEVRKVTA